MLNEERLSPLTEKANLNGKEIEITTPSVAHELEYHIDLCYNRKTLTYKYRPSWRSNPANNNTKLYQFIDVLKKAIN